MSSVYSSNRSSRRISHATAASDSPQRSSLFKPGRISDVIADLAKYNPGSTPQSPPRAQRLWQRRASAKSTEAENIPSTDVFNLDLIEAYEETEEPEPCISPAASDRPPRTSSLAQTSGGSRSLSCDTDFNGPRQPIRRPQKGGWMDRPHPLKSKAWAPDVGLSPPAEIQSARLPESLAFLEKDPSETSFQKKHRRRMTISESKRAARNTIFVAQPSGLTEQDLPPLPSLPALSPSNSTTASVPSLTPTTPLSFMAAPTEDQIRRELELMTLREGADPLINHRYGGRAGSDVLKEMDREADVKPHPTSRHQHYNSPPETEEDYDLHERTQLRRRKSIVEYFRKSPVDKLLDLYLETPPPSKTEPPDKPPETMRPSHKRKPSLARRMTINLRSSKDKTPDVPPVPAQFSPEPSQSRFDFD